MTNEEIQERFETLTGAVFHMLRSVGEVGGCRLIPVAQDEGSMDSQIMLGNGSQKICFNAWDMEQRDGMAIAIIDEKKPETGGICVDDIPVLGVIEGEWYLYDRPFDERDEARAIYKFSGIWSVYGALNDIIFKPEEGPDGEWGTGEVVRDAAGRKNGRNSSQK